MASLGDQHYINLVIKGDTQAFAVLVDQYKAMVFTLALKMLKSREGAEEAAQDSFLKVYRSLAEFKGDARFSTWLYKITYNTCLDRIRKNKKEQTVVAIDEFNEQQIRSLDSSLDALEAQERKQMIQDCLNLLAAEDSFMLTLFYFEEQSIKDIAKIMGIKSNHVKIKLYRSRKKLATVLKTQLQTEMIAHYES